MATTTNYSWTTPDDTSLVKDGAAAIRSLGTSIDTTTKALNPSTTLGDIEYRSSTANTNTRLGIGTTGQVLSVSGGVPVWAAPAAGGMTQISSTTLSGASTTVSSIPSGYNALIVEVVNFDPATNDRILNMRFNADSGSNRHKYVALSTAPTGETYNDTVVQIQRAVNSTTVANHVWLTIPGYARTDIRHHGFGFATGVNPDNAANISTDHYHIFYNQTGAITSLEFLPSSGNFSGGTVILWGVK